MQETSRQSWREYRNSESQFRCYNTITEVMSADRTRGMTGREICEAACKEGLWKRLREMQKMGWLEVVGRRPCTITNKTALIWKLK